MRRSRALRRFLSTKSRKSRVLKNSHRITIYASEVAALIGENPYRSMSQALPDLMLRSFREGTEIGDRIRGTGIKSEEERFEESAKRTGSEDVVEHIMSSVSKDTNIENIQELKREIDVRMKDVIEKQPDTERKEEALELKAKIESKVQQAFGTIQEDSALGNLEKKNLIEKASDTVERSIESLGERASLDRVDTERLRVKVSDALKTKMNDVNIEDAGDIERKFTENMWKDISEKVVQDTIMSSNILNDKDKTQYVRSELPELNRKLASSVKDSTVSGNNAQWYYRKLGNTSRSDMLYGVGGRIDGFSNGKLVEVKNRVRRIPDNLPRYDMIQIQTYLHILRLPQCVVMQRLKNRKDVSSTLDVTAWNTREWNARVASRLQIFSDFVDEITNLDSDGEIDVVTRMELLESLSRKGDSSSESLTRNVFVRFFERRMNDLDMMRAEDEEGGGGGIILN
eukprot:g6723.t1